MNNFDFNAPVPTAPELDSQTTLLVDADYWTYQLAAVLQSKETRPEAGTIAVELSDETIVHVEPLSALHLLIDSTLQELKIIFRTNHMNIYLQGKSNFRVDVAVTKPYKGGRSKVKPYYYQECRDYLIEHFDAIVVDGYETDDQVCMDQLALMAVGMPSVIVSPDKDLKNMFGYNYNPQKKILTNIRPEEAERHFWEQMVIGDNAVDNIPGVYRVGEAWVKKHSKLDNHDFADAVMDLYMAKHNTDYLIEQANLLHMCRSEEEVGEWNVDYDFYRGYVEPSPVEYHPMDES